MTPGERMRALITAQVAKDADAQRSLLADVDQVELAAVSGALLAMCGNLVGFIAGLWETDPARAWEIILDAERRAGT